MTRLVILLVLAGTIGPLAQSRLPTSDAAFEVASIRPNTGREVMIRTDTAGDQFIGTNIPLRSLIRLAYDVGDYQIVG